MNGLEIKVIEQKMPVISINYEEILANLEKIALKYKGLVVTKQTIDSCKASQKELASLRIKIDKYRKEIKNEVKKPIDDFETKCKNLISVISNVEDPIVAGLATFEQERRRLQRQWVEGLAAEMVDQVLEPKYVEKIEIPERFMNITITDQEVVSNLEMQVKNLLEKQNGEKEKIKTIETLIASTNKIRKLITPLDIRDFAYWIQNRDVINLSEVLRQIDLAGTKRTEAEEKAKEVFIAGCKPAETNVSPAPEFKQEIHHGEFIELMNIFKIVLECKRSELDAVVKFIKDQKYKIVEVKYVRT